MSHHRITSYSRPIFFPIVVKPDPQKSGCATPEFPPSLLSKKMPIHQICQRQPLACVIRLAELPRFGSGGMLELATCFFNKALLIDQFSIDS